MGLVTGVELIAAERERQIADEGWTPLHDNDHDAGELAIAGAVYALPFDIREQRVWKTTLRQLLWPFEPRWFKATVAIQSTTQPRESRIRELVKAGALISAEIDRLHRRAGA